MGVLADALRLAPEGLRPLTLVLSVVALSYSSKLLRFHGYIQLAFLCFALTFFINIIFIPIFLGIMGNLGQMEAIPVRYLAGRAVGALITGLIGPVVFYVLDSWLINPKAVK
jgi:rod shape-determining protein MreD